MLRSIVPDAEAECRGFLVVGQELLASSARMAFFFEREFLHASSSCATDHFQHAAAELCRRGCSGERRAGGWLPGLVASCVARLDLRP